MCLTGKLFLQRAQFGGSSVGGEFDVVDVCQRVEEAHHVRVIPVGGLLGMAANEKNETNCKLAAMVTTNNNITAQILFPDIEDIFSNIKQKKVPMLHKK